MNIKIQIVPTIANHALNFPIDTFIMILQSAKAYNAPSSGKRERFGAASEWFSDDLVCYIAGF
jgi:hypothetical protein